MAQALCAKADDIKLPAFHLVAVEALAQARRDPSGPMAPEGGPALAEQVRRAWNDRSPWAARLQVVQAPPGRGPGRAGRVAGSGRPGERGAGGEAPPHRLDPR